MSNWFSSQCCKYDKLNPQFIEEASRNGTVGVSQYKYCPYCGKEIEWATES